MPNRLHANPVWGTPTTAMWMYRLGLKKQENAIYWRQISGLGRKAWFIIKAVSKENLMMKLKVLPYDNPTPNQLR